MNENDRICDFCHEEPVQVPLRYREITGIEERRAKGGANKIIHRTETGRVPCNECVRKMQDGVPIGQQSLKLI